METFEMLGTRLKIKWVDRITKEEVLGKIREKGIYWGRIFLNNNI